MASKIVEKQKKIGKFWFVWNIVEAVLLFAGGVLSIVAGIISVSSEGAQASNDSSFESAIAYIVAAFISLDGLLRIVLHFARNEEDDDHSPLIVAGFEITAGIMLILMQARFNAEHLFTFTVVNFIAILLMVMGSLLLAFAIYVIAKKSRKLFMPIVEILFSAILIGVGIIILILYGSESARDQLVMILVGIVLALTALAMLVITLITNSKRNKEIERMEKEENGIYEVQDALTHSNKMLQGDEDIVLIEDNEEEEKPVKKLPKPKKKK